ncbi:NmrA family NAD(P)-binding protein [Rhizobium bangladeshense]|uniref:NmrA family NAD(P)-binding protein n=1 Tax=Rhizobium bangladeshense TaxID=1138189 RepID=UPI001C83B52D|nr:NmrA family NAD(P)-binding protein [Rhizobium bangladeshense]MBX4896017.1 NmrA family NAD(P)-binding protein [Rhizobium bangladeshense]MBX4903010.1 NmrA family NAD(P)-binding protein [Rhizobium bangladeshense]MBX4914529.1 NmrA family NAD(P)-binding protein [Rhizobium bangladeshense]MBY3613151.1 NmrA family NAD(P)-binding protein [Rhizobium bangladeshense]
MQTSEIVLVGGSGKTGGRIIKRLEGRGITIRPASRSSARPFDWEDRSTWRGALEGASSAYVAFQPDLAVAWAAEAVAALAKVAVECGLEHIVLLSGRGEEGAQRSEAALIASGIDTTILRASWFCQNFSEGAFLEQIRAGRLQLPAGDIGEPFIDTDDIADAAVAALTDPGHRNKTYELTGPRALSFPEAVGEIAAAAGRPIEYEQVSMADSTSGLADAGLPQGLIDLLEELLGQVLDGRNSGTTGGVAEILGRPATDFSEYARRTAATGTWKA